MLRLKDVDGVRAALGDTAISRSALWTTPIDFITPAQIFAFRTRMVLLGHATEADQAINFILESVKSSNTCDGKTLRLLNYKLPKDRIELTSSEMVDALDTLPHPVSAAILFGLEMQMEAEEVIGLTWPRVRQLSLRPGLTHYAANILRSQARHMRCPYVFWQFDDSNEPKPVFGMEQAVFDSFGLLWGELQEGFSNLIMSVH